MDANAVVSTADSAVRVEHPPHSKRGLSDDSTHRLLLLFMRANVSKTGALTPAELAEISWMPMLGGVASTIAQLLEMKDQTAELSPDEWLDLCAQHVGKSDEKLGPWLSMCEAMSDTFPELPLTATLEQEQGAGAATIDKTQLEQLITNLGQAAHSGAGDGLAHTLAMACASGHAGIAQYILCNWKPRLAASRWAELQLLVGAFERSAAAGAGGIAEVEVAVDSDGNRLPSVIRDNDDSDDGQEDQSLLSHAKVSLEQWGTLAALIRSQCNDTQNSTDAKAPLEPGDK